MPTIRRPTAKAYSLSIVMQFNILKLINWAVEIILCANGFDVALSNIGLYQPTEDRHPKGRTEGRTET